MSFTAFLQIASALGIGSLLPWIWKQLSNLLSGAADREINRIENLEDVIDALRRALDKGRFREDSLAQVLGVLIFGFKGLEAINPSLKDALDRSIYTLERVQGELRKMTDRSL